MLEKVSDQGGGRVGGGERDGKLLAKQEHAPRIKSTPRKAYVDQESGKDQGRLVLLQDSRRSSLSQTRIK